MTAVTEGLRERKKAETRRALTSAALHLADRLGPDGVTVEAIADEAGVSPRTFFNYFASKEDAIVGVVPARASDLLAALTGRPDDEPPLEALRMSMHVVVALVEGSPDDWVVRHRLFQRHPALAGRHAAGFAEVERGLVEVVARRTGRDPDRDTYPALVVAAAVAAIRVAITVWQEDERREPLVEVLDRAFAELSRGLDAAGGHPDRQLTAQSVD
jgi:AcrR family transcriptional regulator